MGAKRPKYEIPASAQQALAQARILAADKNMPGEQKALEQVGISAANSVRAAQEGGNVLEAISAIQGQQDRGTQGVLARSEADQQNDQERLMRQLEIMSQHEDMQYQMNEYAPYAEKQQETRDIVGALTQNGANLLLSQQTKAGLATPETPDLLTYDESDLTPRQERASIPPVLSQRTASAVIQGQLPTLPPKGFGVTPRAETEEEMIRRLLGLLQKSSY